MIGVLFFLILFLPGLVVAQEQRPVLINEIAWMGTGTPIEGVNTNQHWRYEWLELYNPTTETLSLESWMIELYRPSSAKATAGEGEEEIYFTILLSGTIAPQEYFLIGASDKIPRVDVNYANLGGKFMNTGMRVVLKDNLGNIVDEVNAREAWPAGDNESKRTMERQVGSDPTTWQTSREMGGTPRAKNSKGLQELLAEEFSFANEKGPARPFPFSSLFSGTTLLAFLLAGGSSAGILALRRFLSRLS